jgi:hypothetical protein
MPTRRTPISCVASVSPVGSDGDCTFFDLANHVPLMYSDALPSVFPVNVAGGFGSTSLAGTPLFIGNGIDVGTDADDGLLARLGYSAELALAN